MDQLGLTVLQAELEADGRVIADAAALAKTRFGQGTAPELEACAYQLSRLYNTIEQSVLRVAKAFENNIDDDQGWHSALLRRLSITIPGIRPAFLSPPILPHLQELRGFRHVVRHAYELSLQAAKMAPLVDSAQRVAGEYPDLCRSFLGRVANERGWPIPASSS